MRRERWAPRCWKEALYRRARLRPARQGSRDQRHPRGRLSRRPLRRARGGTRRSRVAADPPESVEPRPRRRSGGFWARRTAFLTLRRVPARRAGLSLTRRSSCITSQGHRRNAGRCSRRCERSEVRGATSALVVAEVAHRLMCLEAVAQGLVSPGEVARKPRGAPRGRAAAPGPRRSHRPDSPHGRPRPSPRPAGASSPPGALRRRLGLHASASRAAAGAREAGHRRGGVRRGRPGARRRPETR